MLSIAYASLVLVKMIELIRRQASWLIGPILMLEMAKQYPKKNFSYPFPLSKGKSLIAL